MENDSTKPRVPPGQRVTEGFPVFTCGLTPHVEARKWSFRLFGAIENEVIFTFEEFRQLPTTTVKADFHCVTHWSRLNNEWEGVFARDILKMIRPAAPIASVMIHSHDGYSTNLRFSDFNDERALFAYKLDGHELVREHGWPLRFIIPSLYGWKSAKWVTAVEFLETERPGYWEQRGYHMYGNPWKEERTST
jgi:DMSO/TMAO reductase YedYZ molybdopterin-dependent catalytic subunit